MKNILLQTLFTIAMTLGVCVNGLAQLPEIQTGNGISWMMGGIGLDESTAMRAEAKNWPLSIEFSENLDGYDSWISGVHLKIINQRRERVFDSEVVGPIFLADLPSGYYQIIGSYKGSFKTHSVEIVQGSTAHLSMNWRLPKLMISRLIESNDLNNAIHQAVQSTESMVERAERAVIHLTQASLEATRHAAQEAKASIRVAVNKAISATNEATAASKAAAKEAEDAAKYAALLIEDLAKKIDDTLERFTTTGRESVRLTVDTIKEQAKRAQEATIKAAEWVKKQRS